ncbi:general substrate transporter [Cadophora sp. MPI-SDFR-AT-0126]|nr:general substrate transporter [Leotiomycetes sp. MPI-SDFR-AT-0126]
MGLKAKVQDFIQSSDKDRYGPELIAALPVNEKSWIRTKHLRRLNFILLVPLLSSAAIGFDGAMMNGLQSLPQWRNTFGKPEGALLGFMNAIYPMAKVMGLFPATWLGDRYGRKRPMLVGFILLPIGAALQAASYNKAMFIVSRFVLGFSTSFIAQPSPILVTELAYPTHRAKLTSLYNTCFHMGAVLAAWSTYGTFRIQSDWAWRIPSLLQQALPTLQTIGFFFLPESPRWLIAKGREEEGRKILTDYHADGDETSPLVEFEFREITEALRRSTLEEGGNSYLDLIRTPVNRKRTAIAFCLSFFSQWNGGSVISYYLTLVLNTIGITEVSKQTLINGMLQIFNWIVAVFGGALLVDRVGRRGLFLVATTGMMLSYVAWIALNSQFAVSHDATLANAVLAFIFIYYFFYDIAWTPLPISYTAEIFPYTLRGRGITTFYCGTYAGLISSQFINPIAMRELAWKYYILFVVILFFIVVGIYFWLPETKGRTLEEIIDIFEGSSVPLSATVAGQKGPEVTEEEYAPDGKSRV